MNTNHTSVTDAEARNVLLAFKHWYLWGPHDVEAMRRALEQYEAGKSRSQPSSGAVEDALEHALRILDAVYRDVLLNDAMPNLGLLDARKKVRTTLEAIKVAHPQPAASAGSTGLLVSGSTYPQTNISTAPSGGGNKP